jgi:uncharacterized protein YneF (UPF0154 family)
MQTVVNLHQGFHLNIVPVILAAIVFFVILYFVSGRKSKKVADKNIPSRKETYDFMYSQLLDKETV